MLRKTIFLSIVCLFFISVETKAQVYLPCSAGSGKSIAGSIDYSIGQVFYTSMKGPNGEITQGVQQPIEISSVGFIEYDQNAFDLEMQAYPNPSTDYISIQIKDFFFSSQKYRYFLFRINGEMLEMEHIISEITQIDLTDLSAGNYFVRIVKDNLAVKTFKVTKNR